MAMPRSAPLQLDSDVVRNANMESFREGEGGEKGAAVNVTKRQNAQSWRNDTPSCVQRGKI